MYACMYSVYKYKYIVYIYICTYICMYMCVCAYIYIYIYVYIGMSVKTLCTNAFYISSTVNILEFICNEDVYVQMPNYLVSDFEGWRKDILQQPRT